MTDHRTSVVVSLPARTAEAARIGIASSAEAGADLVELRLDLWSRPERARVGELLPARVPVLATLRSRAEGGEGPDDPAERRTQLREVVGAGVPWIDLEWERDRDLLAELPAPDRLGRVFSLHLPAGAPLAVWQRRVEELSSADGLAKLVGPMGVRPLIEELLPILRDRAGPNLTVHTTGPSGPLLRVLGGQFRWPLLYAAPDSAEAPVEPAQLPLSVVRRLLASPGRTTLCAVAGRPIAHTRSPAIHSAWLARDRRNAAYVALEFPDDEEFVASLEGLSEIGVRGLNVTQPFKLAARQAATRVSAGAALCGAANCLTLREGEIDAENTDLLAIDRRMSELVALGAWDGTTVAVVGAGGAARATLAAARLRGSRATVYARRPESAEALAAEFGASAPARPEGPAPLVVHATTAGRAGQEPPQGVFAELLGPGTRVLDWVYDPDEPHVRTSTEAAGGSYEDGWRLLVYQAAASYAIWWGNEPSAEAVATTLREGGCTD